MRLFMQSVEIFSVNETEQYFLLDTKKKKVTITSVNQPQHAHRIAYFFF